MKITLKNIGIISDSCMEINGLTVITGQNNSGKTTVGKVLYSLIDAVSNIQQKAKNDKFIYAINQIEKASVEFSYHNLFRRYNNKIENEIIRIFFSFRIDSLIDNEKIELFLDDILKELSNFDITKEPYISIIKRYQSSTLYSNDSFENFKQQKESAISILSEALTLINSDPDLISYARQAINTTLSTEFSGQIQPVALSDVKSLIEVENNGECCFKIYIENNEIINSEIPVFRKSPYKKSYFIDNPFILDEPVFKKASRYTNSYENSFVNEMGILTHDNKLKFVLNSLSRKSIFEENIIDESLKNIKQMIDNILPGNFEINEDGRFYVFNGIKLKTVNLATGSKMFSIIKILLEKGELNQDTLLVLDEPESHLHPKWQNMFVEIIVLLVKELKCNILLTTHSSNFMLAIDAYMRKYEIMDLCNFYQTEHLENTPFVKYKLVNDSLENIYADFISYLSDVKLLRNQYLNYYED